MSDFRRFCIGALVTMGLFSAMANHFGGEPKGTVLAILQVVGMGFVGGCGVVALWGKRA